MRKFEPYFKINGLLVSVMLLWCIQPDVLPLLSIRLGTDAVPKCITGQRKSCTKNHGHGTGHKVGTGFQARKGR